MGKSEQKSDEAAAVARVADASRELQSASKAIEQHFHESTYQATPTLQMARLTAAINELQSARDALDALLARRS